MSESGPSDVSTQIPAEASLAVARGDGPPLTGNLYNRIAQVAVYAALFLLPLFYLPWTSSILELNKQLLAIVLASVSLVVWLLGVVVSGTMSVRFTPLDKGVLALLVATGIATAAAASRMKALFGINVSLSDAFITMTALSILYFVAVNVFNDRGRMLRRLLVKSGFLVLVLGILQMFTVYILPGGFTHSRAFNTLGSLNGLGVLAAVLLPLFSKSVGRWWGKAGSVLCGAGVVASLVVLAILNWWVLWVIALAGMLAIIGFDSINAAQMAADYAGASRKGRFALSRFVVPMAVIVIGAFLLLVNFNLTSVKSQFPVEISPSFTMSWNIVKGAFKDDLVFGGGPEAFSVAFDRFGAGQLANSQLSDLRFFDATAEVFTWLVHGGAVAALGLLVLLWSLVQVCAYLGRSLAGRGGSARDSDEAAESSGVLASAVAMTVALFLYPFNMSLMAVWFFLLALSALAVSGDRRLEVDIESKPAFSLTASLGFIVGLILALAAVYFTMVSYLGDAAYAHAVQRDTPSAALDGMARAITLNGSSDRYFRDASQLTLSVLREEINKQGTDTSNPQRQARIQNLIASAVQLAQRATALEPGEALNWANLASIYQSLTGLVQDVERLAEDNYRKASELRPGDPSFDNRTGSMWLARADLASQLARNSSGANAVRLREEAATSLDKAAEAFGRALEKAPSYGLAIYNRAAVYDRQGKVTEAITEIERIVPANANNPTLMFELGILYLRDNRNKDALAAMQRAVLLAPQYANARWYLALLQEEAGDVDSALANLQEIAKSNADNEVLAAKIRQLTAVPPVISDTDVVDQEPLP